MAHRGKELRLGARRQRRAEAALRRQHVEFVAGLDGLPQVLVLRLDDFVGTVASVWGIARAAELAALVPLIAERAWALAQRIER